VIVALDLPAVGDDLEQVGLAVAVGVLDARDIGPLGDVEPAVLLRQTEHFMEAVGEAAELRVLRVGVIGVVDQPYLAPSGADRDFAVGQDLDAAGLEHLSWGRSEVEDLVVIVLGDGLLLRQDSRRQESREQEGGKKGPHEYVLEWEEQVWMRLQRI